MKSTMHGQKSTQNVLEKLVNWVMDSSTGS